MAGRNGRDALPPQPVVLRLAMNEFGDQHMPSYPSIWFPNSAISFYLTQGCLSYNTDYVAMADAGGLTKRSAGAKC